ncbi:MAG: hypothetical protein Q8900_07960 [Bacillota bacterium]|nr:hypothetical protein [Bacillota bacterium]
MARKHDFDGAWKSILEAFEEEIIELLFPEIYEEIAWEKETESLDNVLYFPQAHLVPLNL